MSSNAKQFATFTDEQLRKELTRRKEERVRLLEAERERKAKLVVVHIDALLGLTDKHGRTSCSDKNAQNYGRCTRCTLLRVKEEGYLDSTDLSIELSMELFREF